MVTGSSDIIEISLDYRRVSASGLATAFWDGRLDADKKEIWIWLPNSVIEIEREDGKTACVVSLPERLAQEKGLI